MKKSWTWKDDVTEAQKLPKEGGIRKELAPRWGRADTVRYRRACGYGASIVVERIIKQLENAETMENQVAEQIETLNRIPAETNEEKLLKSRELTDLFKLRQSITIPLSDLAAVLPVLSDRAGLLVPENVDVPGAPAGTKGSLEDVLDVIRSQVAAIMAVAKERTLEGAEVDLLLRLRRDLAATEAQRADFVLRAMNAENMAPEDRKKIVARFLGETPLLEGKKE